MGPFIFSCDAHIAEPNDLFAANMPAHLHDWVITARVEDGMRLMLMGDRVIHRLPANFFDHKVGSDTDGVDTGRRGARDLGLRLADMERDGIDGEVLFPSLGLMVSRIEDPEASRVACQIYNDWLWDYVDGLRNTLVPAALLPNIDVHDGTVELQRVIDKGYRAAMMSCVPLDVAPQYNDPAWDEIFGLAAANDIPLLFHTAVGKVNLRALRGPGGALFNYTRQMSDAIETTAALVGGGVLDRNPGARIMFLECGSGWLLSLGERMDEVYTGHAPSISPKLSRRPSDIVRDQVICSFQNDPGFLYTLAEMPDHAFAFASDYPHSEGTFPFSREVVDHVLASTAATDEQKRNVLGLNAARLFHTSPEVVATERASYRVSA